MPVTPFHIGPGVLLNSLAPGRVSFLAFCAANLVIDIESLYNLMVGHVPVHAFLHSWLGATLVIAGLCATFRVGGRLRPSILSRRRPLTMPSVAIGATLGAYTHIVLDSVMHADMQPLAPFSASNPLLGIVPLGALHLGCAALAVLGFLIMFGRWFFGIDEGER